MENDNTQDAQDTQDVQDDVNNQDPQGDDGQQDPNPSEGGQAQDDGAKGDADEFHGAPDAYDYSSIKLPDGMVIEDNIIADFNDFAKKHDLSQKGADEILQMGIAHSQNIAKKFSEAQQYQLGEYIRGLDEMCDNDEALKGAKYDVAVNAASNAIKQLVPEAYYQDFIDALTRTGLSHHPALIHFGMNVNKHLQSPKIVSGRNSAAQKTSAELWYPEMSDKK